MLFALIDSLYVIAGSITADYKAPMTCRSRILLAGVFASMLVPAVAHAATDACGVMARNLASGQDLLATPQLSAMLFGAADNDCPALVPRLVAAGASIATRDRTGGTALTHAARSGRLNMIRELLAHGADINQRDIGGATPLSVAIETSHTAAARALIEAGAEIGLAGHSGVTPLIAAAYNGNLAIVEALLAHNASPDATDATGKSAIIYAAARGFDAIVERLLKAGIDVNAVYANGLAVLSWAAGYAEDVPAADAVAIAGHLLDRGARIDVIDDRGQTPLMIAASMDHAEMLELLLVRGANPLIRDAQGRTAGDIASSELLRTRLNQRPAR